MNKNSIQSPITMNADERQTNTNALRSAIALLLAAALNGVIALRQAIQSAQWQAWVEAAIVLVFLVTIVSSIVFIHRRHTERGTILLLAGFLITLFVRNALTADMGLLYGLVALTVTSVIAFYTMPPERAIRTAVAGLLVGVLLILFDLYAPAYRQSAPEAISKSLPVIAGATSLIIIFVGIRYFKQMNLQTRLTALILIALVPLLVGITVFISSRAGAEIERQANAHIEDGNASLASNVSTWLELHSRTLQEITLLPDVISMDAAIQRPTLLAIAAAHPNLFLVQTTDLNGINIARNDEDEMKDYHDRGWFLGAKAGAPITYEVLISRTTGAPALNMSRPIRDESGQIIGVTSIVSELNEISQEVLAGMEGQMITYIVDATNRVVAHPDPTYTAGEELKDLSTYPPVATLRQGQTGIFSFTDENGETWRAYVSTLENGWGIIAQQPEAELLAPVRDFQRVAYTLITIGTALMLILAWWVIRRMIQPIGLLTKAASAIAAGDLNQKAEVTSQDEIGVLATTFNTMTAQLRDLIGSLEQRVVDRTKALSDVAEISTAASTTQDVQEMLASVVHLTQRRFGLYHAHVFVFDEATEELKIVACGWKEGDEHEGTHGTTVIPIGQEQSLVARAARTKQAVIVNDVRNDPDWLPNPLLPDTASELAVPMLLGDQVVGVLDVQSDRLNGFTESDASIQTTLGSQVAVALQNARLYTQAETSRQEAQSLVDFAPEAIVIVDLETGLFTDLNENAEKLYGMPRQELVKVGPAQMSPPKQPDGHDSTEKAMEKINEAMQGKSVVFEWIHRNAQGEDIRCEIRLVRLPGAHPRVRASVTDITERKRLEELTIQRARQQETLNLITQRIQNTTTVEAALQVAARELGHALGMRQTLVALDPEELAGEHRENINN